MRLLALANILSGVIIFLLSLPLICRKVPMNRFFGVRIRAAFESRQRWYDVNAFGGTELARWSLLIVCYGLAGLILDERRLAVYAYANLAVVLTAVLIPLINVMRWSKKGN
jgi:uncharacterized membrane protein